MDTQIHPIVDSYIFCSGSDSDGLSPSDEDEEDAPDIPACTPLAAFLSFKQESEKRRASQVDTTAKVSDQFHQSMSLCPSQHTQEYRHAFGGNVREPNFFLLCLYLFIISNPSSACRISPGGSHVPPAELPGAVLPLPAAAAAGGPVPGAAEEAPRPAPPADEGPARLLPPAPPPQEHRHL